jgi:hypothetical protein
MSKGDASLKDVYDIVNRIETKLDIRIKEVEESTKVEITGMRERLTTVEVWKGSITGTVAILTGFFSIIFAFVSKWIESRFNL